MMVDLHAEEAAIEEEQDAPQSPSPPKKQTRLMQDAMPKCPAKSKPTPMSPRSGTPLFSMQRGCSWSRGHAPSGSVFTTEPTRVPGEAPEHVRLEGDHVFSNFCMQVAFGRRTPFDTPGSIGRTKLRGVMTHE